MATQTGYVAVLSVQSETGDRGMIETLFAADSIPTKNVRRSPAVLAMASLTGTANGTRAGMKSTMFALSRGDRGMASNTFCFLDVARINVAIAATFTLIEGLMGLRQWTGAAAKKIGPCQRRGDKDCPNSDRRSE